MILRFAAYWGLLLMAISACQPNSESQTPPPPPNIIFIMTDDHAEQAISCYGSELIRTPNLDRLAREGMRFTNSFVTNSICGPSRAVMLTGKYSHLNGLRDNRDEFDGSQVTFPKLLQQAGYQTSIVGKWHLKTKPTGFDYWNVLIGQGDYYSPTMIEMGDTTQYPGAYTTDLITDFALQTIQNRDSSRPFCLLYHHKAPHRNWMPNIDDLDMYANDTLPFPETFWDDYENRSAAARESDMRIEDMYLSLDMKLMPGDYSADNNSGGSLDFNPVKSWERSYGLMTEAQKVAWDAHYGPIRAAFREDKLEGDKLIAWKYQRYLKDYLRCIKSVDDNVGRLLDYLDASGLAENTIVVYTSDQGFYLGEHGWFDKRFMYEESLGMPLMVRYPAAIQAGQVSEEMVLNLDFAETFLDYAGVDIPEEMQGRSFRNILEGNTPEDWRTSMYYQYFEYPHGWHMVKKHFGVRTSRYKLIHFYEDIDAFELFDLEKDPHELQSVYDDPEYRDIQEELHQELARLRGQYLVTEASDI